jgi:hypothetical protein
MRFHKAAALRRASLAAVLLLTQAAGADEGTGMVHGKVKWNGAPLAHGKILFHFDDDQFVGAKIKDGNYSVKSVPTGTLRITVEGEGVSAK